VSSSITSRAPVAARVREITRAPETSRSFASVAWPSETILCTYLVMLAAGEALVSETLIRNGGFAANPLIEAARGALGSWLVPLKVATPLLLLACVAFITRRRNRVPTVLTWVLRAAVIEYALVMAYMVVQLAWWAQAGASR